MSRSNAKRWLSPIALAVAAACIAPVSAQDVDVAAVEARLGQMEREMRELRALLDSHRGTATPAATPAAVPATATATATTAPAPTGSATPARNPMMPGAAPGTTFSFGGFIKFDAMTTRTSDGQIADGSPGRLFYFPGATPVAADGQGQSSTYSDVHAQFSRFWLGADTVTDSGKTIKAYIEADMYGGGSNALAGNEVITNTYALTLRQAYVSYNGWLAGQTWSNFQDVAALPDAVDFTGPSEGTVFNRQAQLRYTRGPWSVSVENPQTTVTPYLSRAARFNSGDDRLPDVTARWITRGDWGHFTVAGLARRFRSGDASTSGAALSVSGRFNLGANDDIRYMVSGGDGIGRYLGFALGSDTVLDADGRLHSQRGYGGFAAWRHAFSPKLRSNVIYSLASLDNDPLLTGGSVTERAQSFRVNMIYSPARNLDVGGELSWADRRLENGLEGDLQRVHTHIKYSF
ncbi:DcaP family trimeric outer membrane transporter [Luteimonas sp. S4-F44]|uniref:DcaP family trimeric outer membrane transporter n=1 Tax=Luteimonas sp. S4-F44 TaxID=2925842 RepID=UPI001F5338AA|nr:DcaP family trimeric outer membrane transporter [Luteimonas sp. S4-F44]UNK42281.1 DcaP family trimeric outer membrane transporter [Luteimonas sp. S4-F44]